MDNKRIKTTFHLKGDYIDKIDSRSEFGFQYKYEQVESDLDAYWSILAYGLDNAREVLSSEELNFIVKIIKGRKISGQDIILWAASSLFESIRQAFRRYSKYETIGIIEDELIEKLQSLELIDRIGLCDWAQKQWILYCDNEAQRQRALPYT